MKKFLITLCLLATVVGLAHAGDEVDYIALEIDNIATNGATASTKTKTARTSGYVYGIYVDVAEYATATAVVSVATTTGGQLGIARTLLNGVSVVDDTYYPVRVANVDTAGSASTDASVSEFPLKGDIVQLTAQEASSTMTTNSVRIILFVRK